MSRRLLALWIGYLIFVCSVSFVSWRRGFRVDTNFLNLLSPSSTRDEFLDASLKFQEKFEEEFLSFVSHQDTDEAIAQAKHFAQAMTDSDLFDTVGFEFSQDRQTQIASFFFPRRKQLLTSEQIQSIQSGKVSDRVDQVYMSLFSPSGSAAALQIDSDPLGLFQEFLAGAGIVSQLTLIQNHLGVVRDGKTYLLVRGRLNKMASRLDERLLDFVRKQKMQREIFAFSPHLYSAAGTEQAQSEINFMGTATAVLIILLLWLVFSSVKTMAVIGFTVILSVVSGMAALSLLFPTVHILSLLLGVSILGVATDYGGYFFSQGYDPTLKDSPSAVKRITRPLTLGFLTSGSSYICFYFTDLVVLRQLAVFAVVGLFTAYLTVLCLFPFLPWKALPSARFQFLKNCPRFWTRMGINRSGALVVMLTLGLIGIMGGFKFNDDVRTFQGKNQGLQSDESRVFELLGISSASFYLVLRAETPESLLRLEEETRQKLSDLGVHKTVSMSQFIPSLRSQKESWNQYFKLREPIRNLYRKLKVKQIDKTLAKVFQGELEPLTVAEFLESGIELPVAQHWLGEMNGFFYSVISIAGSTDSALLSRIENPQVQLTGKVAEISDYLKGLREVVIERFLVCVVIAAIYLTFAFGFRKAVIIMLAPVMASLLALALPQALLGALNLFNILAIILIAGLSIDYSILFSDSKPTVAMHVGVMMSCVTTLISFGVLSFSSTAAVSSLGISLILGILFSYAFSLWVAARYE